MALRLALMSILVIGCLILCDLVSELDGHLSDHSLKPVLALNCGWLFLFFPLLSNFVGFLVVFSSDNRCAFFQLAVQLS